MMGHAACQARGRDAETLALETEGLSGIEAQRGQPAQESVSAERHSFRTSARGGRQVDRVHAAL